MCGIAIILPGSPIATPSFAIDRMTAALAHRGPDAQAVVRFDGCQLGHARLSVIDLEGGRQPMTDPTGRFTVVFNGEIFNYRELRVELQRQGCTFRTHSDTEVLLQGFIRRGKEIVPRLNGQFAFAIWDSATRTLFAARDRFGEKPLFWAKSAAGEVLLASEIKAILASTLIVPKIDRVSVDAYLGLFYVPPDRSIYENVHPLPPGHVMTWTSGQCTPERYWSPRFSCNDLDEIQALDRIRELTAQAVKRQMVADVPIGAFLSGGLDSSTIVAEMAKLSPHPIRTFSVGFGDLIDELPFARDVAAMYHTEHHELQMDIDVPAMLEMMDQVYDEPFADSSNIPTYLVAAHARKHVKVVLSGDGGDEIFGGYDWYTPLLNGNSTAAGDGWERHVGSNTGLLFDRSALWGEGRQPQAAKEIRQRYHPSARSCPADFVGSAPRTGFLGVNESVRGAGPTQSAQGPLSPMDLGSSFDLACYMPGDILVKVDRAAMAHGLEVRSPFLDVDLAEFVLGLPWQMRFGDGKLKRLLRGACENLWPPSVRGRGKQGFGAPVKSWNEKPGVREIWQRVTRPDSALLALLPGVNAVAPELRPQRKWSLLCLGLWLERRSECLANLS